MLTCKVTLTMDFRHHQLENNQKPTSSCIGGGSDSWETINSQL